MLDFLHGGLKLLKGILNSTEQVGPGLDILLSIFDGNDDQSGN